MNPANIAMQHRTRDKIPIPQYSQATRIDDVFKFKLYISYILSIFLSVLRVSFKFLEAYSFPRSVVAPLLVIIVVSSFAYFTNLLHFTISSHDKLDDFEVCIHSYDINYSENIDAIRIIVANVYNDEDKKGKSRILRATNTLSQDEQIPIDIIQIDCEIYTSGGSQRENRDFSKTASYIAMDYFISDVVIWGVSYENDFLDVNIIGNNAFINENEYYIFPSEKNDDISSLADTISTIVGFVLVEKNSHSKYAQLKNELEYFTKYLPKLKLLSTKLKNIPLMTEGLLLAAYAHAAFHVGKESRDVQTLIDSFESYRRALDIFPSQSNHQFISSTYLQLGNVSDQIFQLAGDRYYLDYAINSYSDSMEYADKSVNQSNDRNEYIDSVELSKTFLELIYYDVANKNKIDAIIDDIKRLNNLDISYRADLFVQLAGYYWRISDDYEDKQKLGELIEIGLEEIVESDNKKIPKVVVIAATQHLGFVYLNSSRFMEARILLEDFVNDDYGEINVDVPLSMYDLYIKSGIYESMGKGDTLEIEHYLRMYIGKIQSLKNEMAEKSYFDGLERYIYIANYVLIEYGNIELYSVIIGLIEKQIQYYRSLSDNSDQYALWLLRRCALYITKEAIEGSNRIDSEESYRLYLENISMNYKNCEMKVRKIVMDEYKHLPSWIMENIEEDIFTVSIVDYLHNIGRW